MTTHHWPTMSFAYSHDAPSTRRWSTWGHPSILRPHTQPWTASHDVRRTQEWAVEALRQAGLYTPEYLQADRARQIDAAYRYFYEDPSGRALRRDIMSR